MKKHLKILIAILILFPIIVGSDISYSIEIDMNDYKELKHEDIDKYLKELKSDTDLERSLINTYGFAGLKLVFADRNSENYYQLGDFPQGNPWHALNDLKLSEAIDTIFKPVVKKIPNLISAMKERVRFIYSEKIDNEWRLHYLMDIKLYDGADYYHIYSGGPPNTRATENEMLLAYNWSLPEELVEFYSIHDGFGGVDAQYILASKELTVMGEMMNPITKEQNVFPKGYQFDDLLEFTSDGAGNAQCFLRAGSEATTTVFWDHELWEISEGERFYEFVDWRLSQLDEE